MAEAPPASALSWRPAARSTGLPPPGVVHLWRARTDRPPATTADLAALLTPDERTRAARFRRGEDRARAVVSRAMLRSILAGYLAAAGGIVLVPGPHGKPALAGGGPPAPVAFNVSHAGDWAVCAVTRPALLGVDIEAPRNLDDIDGLARRCLAPEEHRAWRAIPAGPARERAFLAVWTRKEAVVKALGGGLAIPLDGFAVTVDPHAPPRLERLAGDDPAAWSLRAFEPAPDHVGAVAVRTDLLPGDQALEPYEWRP